MTDPSPQPAILNWKRLGRVAFMIFAFVARSLQQFSTLVMTILAARFLLPAEFGIYALGIIFISLAQTIGYTGIFHFVVASKKGDEEVLPTGFWLMTALAVLAALILCIFAYPLSIAFDAPELVPVLLLLAAAQPIAGASAWYNAVLLRREAMFKHFAILFLQNLAALVGGVVLLIQWQSLFALVAFRYVRVLSGAVLYVGLVRERPSWNFSREIARYALRFSLGLYGSRFLTFLSNYAGDLLLGLMFTTTDVGLFRFGSRVAGGATDIIAQPMRSFALARFAAVGRKGQSIESTLWLYTGSMTILIGGMSAVVIVFARPSVDLFFDPAYLAAIGVTYAIAVRAIAAIGWNLLEPTLVAAEKTDAIMRFNLTWTVVIVAGVLAAAPFGLNVLAWSQAALNFCATFAALRMVQRRVGVSIRPAIRAFVVAALLVAAYGAAVMLTWEAAAVAAGLTGGPALIFGLAWALLLSLPVFVVARWARVFSLSIFAA